MTDQIFAGKLSLTDDIPEQPVFERASEQKLDHLSRTFARMDPGDVVEPDQPRPLPEPILSPAAQRVRAEAARLRIDYDAEVAKILSRMKGGGMGGYLPGPYNSKAGPDPLKNVSAADRRLAETAAAEIIRREHGIRLTWEE